MTWGTHCHQCGRITCQWVRGRNCEGLAYPTLVSQRDAYERLPLWRRVFTTKPPRTVPFWGKEEVAIDVEITMTRICWPCVIGGLLGTAITLYAFVYTPMRQNYERNGCAFIVCDHHKPETK